MPAKTNKRKIAPLAMNAIGYFGPRPPTQDKPHHYHFEVFCLDSYLDIDSGADREQLIKAMAGHVLAKGELVGLYEARVS